MTNNFSSCTNRRQFLGCMLSACTAICVGGDSSLTQAASSLQSSSADETHKFQQAIDPPLTYKQWAQHRNLRYIGILKHLQKNIGSETLLDLLKKASYAENVALGQRLSSRISDMNTFAGPFRNENSNVGHTIVREVVEDNAKVFEMKITQCLVEEVFREADARDLGYACICHADFGLPVGMDLDIKLTRTKTLMQGHDCCNHRYVWEE
jgi:hypothetical protein